MSKTASLVLLNNGIPSTVFFLNPDEITTIGRSPECTVVLKDTGCSRVHASIAWHNDRWEFTDHESRNGSAVNDRVIEGTIPIQNGDRIQLAHTILLFCYAGTDVFTSGQIKPGTDSLEWSQSIPATIAAKAHQAEREDLTSRLTRERDENRSLRRLLGQDSEIIGESPKILELLKIVGRVAESRATVLIRGESGVGKELVARAIHFGGARRERPLVCLNCSALSESLLESELFGHEKGAFTGAIERKIGKFEVANHGTLFLDEIAEMAPGLQAKFLRVLEGQPFERVGGNKPIHVDVRVIAATNRNLEKEVRVGRFRRDLFFRLHVLEIPVPPLRERGDDVLLLANHFRCQFALQMKRKFTGFTDEAVALLRSYRWPGNVRELKNVVERAILLGTPPLIPPEDLLLSALPTPTDTHRADASAAGATDSTGLKTIEEMEKDLIYRTLEYYEWNKTKSAKSLGIDRTTLDRKLVRYEITPKTP
ncbi:MAG: sigma 54-interacting transcriptional regulator [Thermoguttaceae bacterium]|jgi:transcriptional regulator with GAF, ATPase, and Fis domain